MKTTKKIVSILLALAMVLSLATTAFAEDGEATPATYSITINNTADGHTYEAYQIFVGDVNVTGEGENATKVLSNVVWGSSVNYATLGDAETAAKSIATIGADAFAEDIAPYLTTPVATTSTQTDGKYVLTGLTPGYYLVKDQNNSLNGENDSYTKYILEVVEDSTVSPKSSVPSVQKKVDDINDSNNTEDEVVWNDSADYDIGDLVPFQLKATLADNVSAYASYKIIFHDTMSKGLTYKAITKVTVDGNEVTDGYTVSTVKNEDGTTSLTITFNNIKNQGAGDGDEVIVEYTAELNENAVLGNQGNPNYVYLEYSNNPNWEGDLDGDGKPNGEDDDDDNDGTPDKDDDDDDNDGKKDDEDDDDDNDGTPDNEEDKEDTGETPEDKVIVFTYKVIVNKTHQTGTDEEGKPVYEALPGAGFTLYKKVLTVEDDPETEEDETVYDYVAIGEELVGDALTTFEWKGLDDGDYKLVETTTPAGYNTIADIFFTITANHDIIWEQQDQDKVLTELDGGNLFTGEVTTGAVSADVVNKPGTVLPETGGVGTTVFYILGAALMLGTAVVLVARKRMSVNA